MQIADRFSRLRLHHKLMLSHGAVTLVALLVALIVVLNSSISHSPYSVFGRPRWEGSVVLLLFIAVPAGMFFGSWASLFAVRRRLERVSRVSREWLLGKLVLRIADPIPDELGSLSQQLDTLVRRLEQDERDLSELRERNRRLTDQVRLLTQVEERNRLARELHDGVKQHLFSLAMTSNAIRTRFGALQDLPEDMHEMVLDVEQRAQSAQREMTRLIDDLRPRSLQEQGLPEALNDYTLLFGAREHLLVYLNVQGDASLLPVPVAEALYRVAQEALQNVARHAQATRADVSLSCTTEQVSLTVQDNGVGFDATRGLQGLGLTNMEERMIAIGGRLAVNSRNGSGTTVLAEAGLGRPLISQRTDTRPGLAYPPATIENWAWLVQKTTIPAGQTWPWAPDDQEHMRHPLIEPEGESLIIQEGRERFGLRKTYTLRAGKQATALIKVYRGLSGYRWGIDGVTWRLQSVQASSGGMLLLCNGRPVAAMQRRTRLLDAWSEIIYDQQGYRLCFVQDQTCPWILKDEAGEALLHADCSDLPRIELRQAIPLPLLLMVLLRILENTRLGLNHRRSTMNEYSPPSIGALLKTLAVFVVIILYAGVALNTSDPLWFWTRFDAHPQTMTLYCYGEDLVLDPQEQSFAEITALVNRSMSGSKRWDETYMSGNTYRDYRTHPKMMALELTYPKPIRIHTDTFYFSNVKTLIIPLEGTHAYTNAVFGRTDLGRTSMGALHVESFAPLVEYLQTEGICPRAGDAASDG